jgi:hypothetical protein
MKDVNKMEGKSVEVRLQDTNNRLIKRMTQSVDVRISEQTEKEEERKSI